MRRIQADAVPEEASAPPASSPAAFDLPKRAASDRRGLAAEEAPVSPTCAPVRNADAAPLTSALPPLAAPPTMLLVSAAPPAASAAPAATTPPAAIVVPTAAPAPSCGPPDTIPLAIPGPKIPRPSN